MASPLNTFKSVAVNLTTVSNYIYTCPAETTAIILLAQATNVNTNTANVTFFSSLNSNTELVKDFSIPTGDAAELLGGKLVIEAGNSVGAFANTNNHIKLTLSILETI